VLTAHRTTSRARGASQVITREAHGSRNEWLRVEFVIARYEQTLIIN
jgi:hypothetical protein